MIKQMAPLLCRAQLVLLLLIYFWLGVANLPPSVEQGVSDLLLHGIGYAVAVFSVYLLCQRLAPMWVGLAGLWLFSLLVEVVQYYLPWRSFSVLDMLANGSGILAGFILLGIVQPLLDRLIACLGLSR